MKKLAESLLVLFLCILTISCSEEKSTSTTQINTLPTKKSTSGLNKKSCEWQTIPYKIPVYQDRSELIKNKARKLSIVNFTDPNFKEKVSQKYWMFIQGIPLKNIRHNLVPLLKSKKIGLGYIFEGHFKSVFVIESDGTPVIMTKVPLVANAVTFTDYIELMSSVVHEFVHYKQWLQTTDPLLKATFTIDFDSQNYPGLTKAQMCRWNWPREREAHYVECEALAAFGLLPYLPTYQKMYCNRIENDQAFDQGLFLNQVKANKGGPKEDCLKVWAKIIGHPCPEQF